MTDKGFEATLGALDDLLEAERAALITGDLDQIGRLLTRKEALIERLAVLDTADQGALVSLSKKVARNQVLLDNALEGIRSVSQRLAILRRMRHSLDTYDAQGTKRSIEVTSEGSVEKRA